MRPPSPVGSPQFCPEPPDLSVVICTYNRSELVERAVRTVLAHTAATPRVEIIVVDNNSTDRTREIITAIARDDSRVRYVVEAEQGLSAARNAGIRHARAPLLAFTDDDVRVDEEWAGAILRAFAEHPDVDAVGGRVLPVWPSSPPEWLTRDHWAPLALADHGDSPLVVRSDAPICLIGANLACRRTVCQMVGGFATDLQRVKDGVGSLEDHEFLLRLLRLGRKGLYDPRIVVRAEIQPERLERAYHRRWHTGHGHFHARLRSEQVERSGVGTFLGVPAHLYRQALEDAVGWIYCSLRGDQRGAFRSELQLRFFAGFFEARRAEFLTRLAPKRRAELPPLMRRSSFTPGTAYVPMPLDRR